MTAFTGSKLAEAKHLSRVCRLRVGDEVEIFDGRGNAIRSKVVAVGNNWVDLTAVGRADSGADDALSPDVLASAVPKADRFDWLVEKATELGVGRLIPLDQRSKRWSSPGRARFRGWSGRLLKRRSNAVARG